MNQAPTNAPPSPQRIMMCAFGFIPTLALASGVELELFSHIDQGADDLQELCRRTGASDRGLFRLLSALTALGFLHRENDRYSLAPDTAAFLVKEGRGYLGNLVRHHKSQWEQWSHLTTSVIKGTSVGTAVESDEDDGKFFAAFVDSLYNVNYPAAQTVAGRLCASGAPISKVLDIGAGSGVWSLCLAQAMPSVEVTAVDRREVLDSVTRPFAERLGVGARYHYQAGNFRDVDLGEGVYDVAYLGHILHSEGRERSRTVLQRTARALRSGGLLVVAEMVADPGHSSEVFPQLFGLNMLVNTEQGDVFSGPELEELVHEAGFLACEWLEAPSPSPVLLARKS